MMKSLWPDETQQLLLRAAIGEREDAIPAFERWQGRVDLSDHLDPASFRMLPLLHHNLKLLGHDDPLMARLAGVFRYNWVSTQKRHEQTARLLDLLGRSSIPVMLNKGISLGICFYDHPAHRPMSDVDLMVPRDRVKDAAAILKGAGWRVSHTGRENISWRDIVDYRHSAGFRDADGHEMDLHWAPSSELRGEAIERFFWETAWPMAVRGVAAVRPSATCMLLHTAVHGVRYNRMPPFRWIADAHMILMKEGDQIDWHALITLARKTRTSMRLAMAFGYLRSVYGMAIPDHLIDELCRERPDLVERIKNMSALVDPNTSLLHLALADRRIAAVTQLFLDSKGRRLPGMVARWIGRELSAMVMKKRNARLG
jgi:hypothetical protein